MEEEVKDRTHSCIIYKRQQRATCQGRISQKCDKRQAVHRIAKMQ